MKSDQCQCRYWATIDGQSQLMGNGHNPTCQLFKPSVGALELLKQLVAGIRYWASQEDGVPDELWDAYAHAVLITEGKVLDAKKA